MAAIQQAIVDGVDVLNFSIGGGNNPYSDPVELAFLDAYEAGIFVAASAGNDGPAAETTEHRGPWVTTVAASTTDRSFRARPTSPRGSDSLNVTGASVMGPVPTSPVVLNTADPLCLIPAAPGTFAGQIVVCKRGANARVDKGFNVLQGGAAGMILYNPTAEQPERRHPLPAGPAYRRRPGAALVAFLTGHAGDHGQPLRRRRRPRSGRGRHHGGLQLARRAGPDPGHQQARHHRPRASNILAGQTPKLAVSDASPPDQLFQIISGTSMSSPHIAVRPRS